MVEKSSDTIEKIEDEMIENKAIDNGTIEDSVTQDSFVLEYREKQKPAKNTSSDTAKKSDSSFENIIKPALKAGYWFVVWFAILAVMFGSIFPFASMRLALGLNLRRPALTMASRHVARHSPRFEDRAAPYDSAIAESLYRALSLSQDIMNENINRHGASHRMTIASAQRVVRYSEMIYPMQRRGAEPAQVSDNFSSVRGYREEERNNMIHSIPIRSLRPEMSSFTQNLRINHIRARYILEVERDGNWQSLHNHFDNDLTGFPRLRDNFLVAIEDIRGSNQLPGGGIVGAPNYPLHTHPLLSPHIINQYMMLLAEFNALINLELYLAGVNFSYPATSDNERFVLENRISSTGRFNLLIAQESLQIGTATFPRGTVMRPLRALQHWFHAADNRNPQDGLLQGNNLLSNFSLLGELARFIHYFAPSEDISFFATEEEYLFHRASWAYTLQSLTDTLRLALWFIDFSTRQQWQWLGVNYITRVFDAWQNPQTEYNFITIAHPTVPVRDLQSWYSVSQAGLPRHDFVVFRGA